VLRPGGHIFVAVADGATIGCCALLLRSPGVFEVAKMAVAASHRGRGVGRRLLERAIAEARRCGARALYLETNHTLANAVHLYESVGFRHIPPERMTPSPYARADVYMEMEIAAASVLRSPSP
jgi:N-acetylglutamate synthase-like GNAT family acetyltransferase